jgi:hypothetical protein
MGTTSQRETHLLKYTVQQKQFESCKQKRIA